MPKPISRIRSPFLILFVLFFLSGFTGLIYESIWTRYLKLFLGHAAYAQTLVLVTFMGGMAIGAMLASRYSPKITNLLVGYALVELLIGISGIIFHPVFQSITELGYRTLIPSLSTVLAVKISKWLLAAALILPQSILLGATFPLMGGGMIRLNPKKPGRILGLLYFTNSLGAVFGVLAGGFLLINWVGLPGTILTAGLLNIILAVIVWHYATGTDATPHPIENKSSPKGSDPAVLPGSGNIVVIVLVCSAITGCASFLYEIGWIRMLSLVLGSTTHSFELMLSAFILGLALGGYWIRTRIDKLRNPILVLGIIQLVMAMVALSTLVSYDNIFELMRMIVKGLPKSDEGYLLFNLCSQSLTILLMLPATICAGMTLPLLTAILLRRDYGEQAIGKVYSANTLGGIIGIILAIQVIMVPLGVKNVITIGCLLDLLAGIYLINIAVQPETKKRWMMICSAAALSWAAITVFYQLDTVKMASGVYRHGAFLQDAEILFHQDGKTASIDIYNLNGKMNVSTNGKPDAGLSLTEQPSKDELTVTLLAALPMAINPDAKNIAVIGLGSGWTTRSLLLNPNVSSVDTIEIEPVIIEAVRRHGIGTGEIFSDPRSSIFVEDAKVFFTNHRSKYDLIISEPSNPWISGIASMFSSEFYRLVRNHIADNGLFVQWFHIYDNNIELIASVMKALTGQFEDYTVYSPVEGDLIIVASADGQVKDPSQKIFQTPRLSTELARLDIKTTQDLNIRRLGGKKSLGPFFHSFQIIENSDFFPVLDLRAGRSRFLAEDSIELLRPIFNPLSPVEIVEDRLRHVSPTDISKSTGDIFFTATRAQRAVNIHSYLVNSQEDNSASPMLEKDIQTIERFLDPQGDPSSWRNDLHQLAGILLPFLSIKEIDEVFSIVEKRLKRGALSEQDRMWLIFYRSATKRNYSEWASVCIRIRSAGNLSEKEQSLLVMGQMLAHYGSGEHAAAIGTWEKYGRALPMTVEMRLVITNCLEGLKLQRDGKG